MIFDPILFFNAGDTVFRISNSSATAEIITVPGESTVDPSGYFCAIDNESFPVGILIPNRQAKSLTASTAWYNLAFSPSFFAGHIQLALNETPFNPCESGAHTKLVNASAMASLLPVAGSINAAAGA